MVVFVLMRIHELVDVFAGPGVLVAWCWRDWLGRPCLPLVAEPCVEPWDLARWDAAVVDGSLVAAERGLEPGELDGVSGDGRVQVSRFGFGLAAFRADGSGIGFGEMVEAGFRRGGLLRFAGGRGRRGIIGIGIGLCHVFAWLSSSNLLDGLLPVSLPFCSPFAWLFSGKSPDVCLAFWLAALRRPPLLPALRRASRCSSVSVFGSLHIPSA